MTADIRKYLSVVIVACMVFPTVYAFEDSLYAEKDLERIRHRLVFAI